MRTTSTVLAGLCALAVLTGCAGTRQARDVETSGFLGSDYARLQEGGGGEALLVYRDRNVDWAAYDKIRLDPVTIWGGEGSFDGLSGSERQDLADTFWTVIYQEVSKDYKMVGAPGPGVLRIEVALTDADASSPGLDTVSSIVPQARLISEAVGLVTGQPNFVGSARAEARITDGANGKLLAAGVDERVGSKSVRGALDSMDDVHKAFRYWAQQLRYRLCRGRGGADCVPPEA